MKGLLGLIILVADIIAVLDCVKSTKTGGKKALWIVLIIIFPLVGVVAYYLVGKKA